MIAPANTSPEEQALRAQVDAWGRARWGADVRVLHELALGDRRIDMVFVLAADLVGVEVKGPRDSLSDGRTPAQLREFKFYLPEVWLAVDAKWEHHDHVRHAANVIVRRPSGMELLYPPRVGRHRAARDEFGNSRLIELLWNDEAARIAQRTGVIPGNTPTRGAAYKVKAMLARLLTGHEIVKEVCRELRARPLVGMASDAPMRTTA